MNYEYIPIMRWCYYAFRLCSPVSFPNNWYQTRIRPNNTSGTATHQVCKKQWTSVYLFYATYKMIGLDQLCAKDWLIDWLIIYSFTSRSRIFDLYGNVTIAGEGLQNLGICSALRAFEQGGIFIVPHLLWHGASFFPVSSEGPPHLVIFYALLT
jgi:hypothetical protein